MNAAELVKKMNVILEQEYNVHSKPVCGKTLRTQRETVEALINLHKRLSGNLGRSFEELLLGNPIPCISHLPFELFLRIGKIESAFMIFLKPGEALIEKFRMLNRLEMVLRNDSNFTDKKLEIIKNYLLQAEEKGIHVLAPNEEIGLRVSISFSKRIKSIRELVTEIRFEKVKDELSGEMLEEDFEQVTEKIDTLGLPSVLSKAFNNVKEYYWKSKDDDFERSKGTNFIRNILVETVKYASVKLSEFKKETIPKMEGTEFVRFKSYLKSKDVITEDEMPIINGFHSLLSSTGSHSLISDREAYRLKMNMIVELSLLILTRLENFLKAT